MIIKYVQNLKNLKNNKNVYIYSNMFKFNQVLSNKMVSSLKAVKKVDILSNNVKKSSLLNKFNFKSFAQKDNYKDMFKSFVKDQEISPEQAKKKKEDEENKLKESLEEAKKKYEEESRRKKELFEKIKNNEPIDNENDSKNTIEINISMSKIKDKFSSLFSGLKSSTVSKDTVDETKTSVNSNDDTKKENKEEIKENLKENIKVDESNNQEKINTEDNKNEEQKKNEEIENEKVEKKESLGKRILTGFIDVWKTTFPGEENIESRFEKRREEARILKEKIKEASEEEIQKAEEDIPEWKRGALVLIQEEVKEIENIFDKARKTIKQHIRNSEVYKNFRESDTYRELEQIKIDYKEARKNLRDEISASQNPFIVVSRDLMDKVQFKSSTSYAVTLIRRVDPDFDLFEFEKEVDLIFKDFFEAFLRDDLDYLEKVSASTALGMMTGVIKSRKELKATSKYKELIWIDKAQFISASMPEPDNPVLRFRLHCQEINCLVSKENGKVLQGDENQVESCQYNVDLCRNPNPEVDIVGHPWLVVGVERIGVVKQLV